MSAPDLDELYQSIILDHYRRPRNFRALPEATGEAAGRNPLCGDELTVWVKVDGDTIDEVTFQGSGCAISRASASLMTAAVKGKTRAEADALFTQVHAMVTGGADAPAPESLGSVRALAGVGRFPMRVKCASLAWHALKAALERPVGAVSTE